MTERVEMTVGKTKVRATMKYTNLSEEIIERFNKELATAIKKNLKGVKKWETER